MEEAGVSGGPKKPRLVFTDLQRRTLQAIFKETKRPSKEMQITIARQLGLDPSTVSNFFMNARRRSIDKWREDDPSAAASPLSPCPPGSPTTLTLTSAHGTTTRTVLVTTADGMVQHLSGGGDLSPSALTGGNLDL